MGAEKAARWPGDSFFPGLGARWVALILGIITLFEPSLMSAGQKFRENLDEVVLAFLVLVAFAPLLILGLPVFSSVGDFLVFRYFGIAWVFLGYDNYLSSRWRVPSLNKAIRAIEKRKSRLEQNLLRISDELERIGPGGKTKLILEAREKLRFG